MKLPGVGKVLAERIVTNRPYANVDDLKRVNGIGAGISHAPIACAAP